MDRSSGKRIAGGNLTPRKTYRASSFKEAASERNQNDEFCSRIGCSGRIKFNETARIGISDKSKYSKPSFRSINGNEVTAKSSRSDSVANTAQRSCLGSNQKIFSQVTSDAPESKPLNINLNRYQSESMTTSAEVNMTEAGSSRASTGVGPRKTFRYKSAVCDQSTSAASPVPSACKSSALEPFNRNNRSIYGLRNMRCNSISDAIPPGCMQQESLSAMKNFKRRSSEGGSSSSNAGRKNAASPNMNRHTSLTTTGLSISDLAYSSSTLVEDSSGSSSTWNRRSPNLNARMRFSSQENARNSSPVREPALSFSSNEYELPLHVGDGSSSQQFSVSGSRSHRRSRNNSENSSSRTSFASAESGLTHLNQDVLRRFNVDGIAEVLLALERIEQEEELTHEQIIALETSLFLSDLNLYDRHRDMRLDIDNMSYEELLALEERMGSVSTALSEDALSRCLIRSIYETTPSKKELSGSDKDGDDIKCSICQEEYVIGDEIGNLVECRHGYHATCINQWLKQKNWCPVCRASAAPLQLPSSS